VKIVFIGPFGLRPKATMSVRALLLAQALVARGHELTMLIPPWDDPERAGQSWEDGGVHIVNVALPPRLPLLFHILLTRTLVAQALALKPEVIHCFKPKAYAGLAHLVLWWLRRLGGFPGLRLVVDADDWEQAWNDLLPYSASQRKLFTWQEKWGLRHADAVTVASRALEKLVIAQGGGDSSRVFYVPNGYHSVIATGDPFDRLRAGRRPETGHTFLPPSPVPRPPSPAERAMIRAKWQLGNAPTILLYSRFAEFRLERIVRLVGEVAAQMPQARWLIVGKGLQGEEKRLEMLLAEADLTEYVCFTGWLPVEQLPIHFAVADVAVYPYDDTLMNRTKCSVKLIDLLAAGLAVVADAVGQNVEYLQNGESGVLTPPADDTALAAALVALLQEPERRQKLGQAARQYLEENFSWSSLAQIVEKAYR
jgi:glycosyltransferase involved in cell wall biosynthesis